MLQSSMSKQEKFTKWSSLLMRPARAWGSLRRWRTRRNIPVFKQVTARTDILWGPNKLIWSFHISEGGRKGAPYISVRQGATGHWECSKVNVTEETFLLDHRVYLGSEALQTWQGKRGGSLLGNIWVVGKALLKCYRRTKVIGEVAQREGIEKCALSYFHILLLVVCP